MLIDRFRNIVFWSGKMPQLLSQEALNHWAKNLYHTTAAEPPLRGAVFTIEQLELHAKSLAIAHKLAMHRDENRLLRRLADSEIIIARCHDIISRAYTAGLHLTPVAEWLLDNHYLIVEQVYLTRKHFPRGYSRQLPRLSSGGLIGLPRVYDLIFEFISHVEGRVDEEALSRYITAYQSVSHLNMGELWSVAIMLRLSLIENLRRVAMSISWQRTHRDSALLWAQRIDVSSDKHESALMVLADMVSDNPPLSTAFVAQFTQALKGRDASSNFVMAWLEQRLSERGQTIEEVVRAESQTQTADQASMANTIASLRLVNAIEWHRFVEAHSITENILRKDPAGVYSMMDFNTRDEYRHAVESLARRLHISEEQVAETAVSLCDAQSAGVESHVGYMLVDEGKPLLNRTLRSRKPLSSFFPRLRTSIQLFAYLTPIVMLSSAIIFLLFMQFCPAPNLLWVLVAFVAFLAVSHAAMAVMNWFVSIIRKPRALPRMNFEHGIPESCRTIVVIPTMLTGNAHITSIIEHLELRYLANRDPNLWFGLLTDFCDAASAQVADDDALLACAVNGIEALNKKYGNGTHGRFFLFHRPRLENSVKLTEQFGSN